MSAAATRLFAPVLTPDHPRVVAWAALHDGMLVAGSNDVLTTSSRLVNKEGIPCRVVRSAGLSDLVAQWRFCTGDERRVIRVGWRYAYWVRALD